MKRYELTFHPEAVDDLDRIDIYISGYAGETVAHRRVAELKVIIDQLAIFPNIGSPRPSIVSKLRLLPHKSTAVICFTVDDDARIVKIICIAYAGQDWQAMARERDED
jgi:plasmid stabilization system protein ParE